MGNLNEQEKRDSLTELLIELSKAQDLMRDAQNREKYFNRLEDIYYNEDKDNFRHYYSDIFSTLTLIDGDSSIGSLDILAQNIQAVKEGYLQRNFDKSGKAINVKKEIVKLYDHTNLDIARINYTKTMTNETMSELAKNKSLVTTLDGKVEESIQSLTDVSRKFEKKQEGMQREYITILGIFAAIVLAFTGGMVFSSSVLENIHKASAYRMVFITLIIGFVFFNLIALLIDFIRDINKRPTKKKWFWICVNLFFVVSMIGLVFSFKYRWLL